jgi:DNA modification methylase
MTETISDFFSKNSPDNYLLYCGDAAKVLRDIPERSLDCCITSPPYWQQREYAGNSELGKEAKVESYLDNLSEIFALLKQGLKDEGSFWLNLGDTYKNKNLMGIPWRVALKLQDDGWILRNAVVWNKVKGNPCNAKDKLRNVYEHIFHFVKKNRYYYNVDAIRTSPKKPFYKNGNLVTPTGVSGVKYRQQIVNSKELNSEEKQNALTALEEALQKVETGEMPDFRMIIRGKHRSTHSNSLKYSGREAELKKRGFCILPYHKNGSKPDDLWNIIPEDEWRKDSHFAVFPKELCEIPIKATCPPDGIVIDPFVGTGTAIVAALELNRRGIGIDVSSEYLEVARKRIESNIEEQKYAKVQLSLF